MIRWLCVAVALVLGGCAGSASTFSEQYEHGAVAADHYLASEAGAEMLRKGGNAVDAAVATSFTLSVVRPESCGIGGGGFMVIHFADGRAPVAINYRETAPAAVGPDYYESLPAGSSTRGGKAAGVPGTVAGLLYALEKYGTLDRRTVMAPAIRAAERGFRADKTYVGAAREAAGEFEKDPKLVRRFAYMWVRHLGLGKVQVGDVIRMPELATGLRLIAEQGRAGFYDGPIAQATVEWAQRDGGALTREDLRGYTPVEVEPLRFDFAGRTFLTMPPPSSGGVAMAEALGVLSRTMPMVDWGKRPRLPEVVQRTPDNDTFGRTPEYQHALTESLKHAFADRSRWLGDPAFAAVPVAHLLSPGYHDSLAAAFDPARTLKQDAYGTNETGQTAPDDQGTSHLSVVDRWGNAVACTETVNLGYGSWRAVAEFGFLLNNEMDDFTTRRGKANAFGLRQSDLNLPAPGKRPLSSMTPTIVLAADGGVEVVAGASGGPRIITGTMQSILNVVLFEVSARGAVAAPRLHHQWSPDVLRLEPALMADAIIDRRSEAVTLADSLARRGHRVEPIESVGNVQLIRRRRDGPGWDAACDPRKGGRPAGH